MAKKKDESGVAGIGHNGNTTAEELRQFIEQIESLQADAKAIGDDIKEKFSEAKGRGFDTKVMRAILGERKKNAEEVEEFEAVRELYRSALGMGTSAKEDESGDDENGMV